MRTFLRLFVALSAILLAFSVRAESPSALAGTAWKGTFNSSAQLYPGEIYLCFLGASGNANELRYFHQMVKGTELTDVLALTDGPCTYTPRSIELKSSVDSAGQIHIYTCAASAEDELAKAPTRAPQFTIPVSKIAFEPGRLQIQASVFGYSLNYDLTPDPERHACPKP